MSNVPVFFVPAASPEQQEPEQQESDYADLAKLCHRSKPPIAERIYSITYRHNGDEWTATVGESLHGTKTQIKKVQGMKMEVYTPISDPAVVLAIFPGEPFLVVTNHRIAGHAGSAWENPFFAGRPNRVIRFATSKE